jgi:phosphatidylethanolamine/phosphatidyl-N-methylethanolamine N-methyltransferase
MHSLRPRLQEISTFLGAWIREPAATGAISPSSPRLARLMTQLLQPAGGPVLELGPGTGAFTRAMLDRGLPERDLVLVESNPRFAALLRERHPQARVLQMDAMQMRRQAEPWDGLQAQAVLSGLPLLTMGPRAQLAIVSAAFRALRPGAAMLQFTYATRCPISPAVLRRLGLRAERLGGTLVNLPPASVYRLTRSSSAPPFSGCAARPGG